MDTQIGDDGWGLVERRGHTTAFWYQTCPDCGDDILHGDPIWKRYGRWVCELCAAEDLNMWGPF